MNTGCDQEVLQLCGHGRGAERGQDQPAETCLAYGPEGKIIFTLSVSIISFNVYLFLSSSGIPRLYQDSDFYQFQYYMMILFPPILFPFLSFSSFFYLFEILLIL